MSDKYLHRNPISEKSMDFAVRIVKLYKFLSSKFHEYSIFKQILRSGTSIGANVSEAQCAISQKDFLSKMFIAYKEASETMYWLKLLRLTDYLNEEEFDSLYADCNELYRLLSKITKTASQNIETK